MGYIIVWRNGHKEPHLDINDHGFKQEYSSYKDAKDAAEEAVEWEGSKSPWYFDYAIYEEVQN